MMMIMTATMMMMTAKVPMKKYRNENHLEAFFRIIMLFFQVLANLYSFHMDPDIFLEPEKFFPARFLNDSGSVVNMCKDQVIPFSIGGLFRLNYFN